MFGDGDIIEFGRFRLHRRNRTLLADGLELDLGARAIEVLLALIDAGGALVSKDELLTRVWSDAIVEENNLHVQIFALRRALGADRDLIRTVPRRGYSFTGHVMASPKSASAAHVDPEPAASPASNLPILLGELIGRETDLQQVVELQTSHRLLTLTGPGGIGKTSLGIAAAWRLAEHHPDGVRLADLATLADPDLILPSIATALDLSQLPSPLLPEHVVRSLGSRRLLLVLDNCEHLIEPVACIAEALLHGPRTCGSSPPAGNRCAPVANVSIPFRPWPCQTWRSLTSRLSSVIARCACLSNAPALPTPGCHRLTPTPQSSPASAGGSTAFRWQSNWRPPVPLRWGCGGSPTASMTVFACWPADDGRRYPVTRPCERRSTGATGCSPRTSAPGCVVWRFFPVASSWKRPGQS